VSDPALEERGFVPLTPIFMFSTTRITLSIFVFYSFKTHSDQNMLIGPTPIYVIVVQVLFGILAIATQYAALSSKNNYSLLIHGMAWCVEVLISTTSFFIISLFSTPVYASASLLIGIIIILLGFGLLYTHIKKMN